MHRLGHCVGNDWIEHSHAPVFERTTTSTDTERLEIGVPGGNIAIIQNLLGCIDGPFYVLYVLVVSRGEGQCGRYQSPLVDRQQVDDMLERFKEYFRSDGRFHLWIHSPASTATLVWDRHNLIYAYGALRCFEQRLVAMGFQGGKPRIPAPHQHHYHSECDESSRAMLTYFDWRHSELQPSDDS